MNTTNHTIPAEPSGCTDEDLMKGIKDGDEGALETIIKRHGAHLQNTIRRILSNDSDTEDIVSQVWVELWSKASNYSSDKGKPLSWLMTIGNRKAIDHIRKSKAYSKGVEKIQEAVQSTPSTTAGKHGARDDCRHILQCMEEIPEEQAKLLMLCYVRGQTKKEAALTEDIPLGTAKTRIGLGIKKLRDRFFR